MLANFGFGALVVTFLLALFGASAAVYGYFRKKDRWVESARRAVLLTFPLVTLAALSLVYFADYRSLRAALCILRHQQRYASLFESHSPMGRPGRLSALLVLADVGLCLCGHAASVEAGP